MMKLYMIRHAKAQDRSLGIYDPARSLTDVGRHRLRQMLPALQEELKNQSLILWASHAARAQETAIQTAIALKHATIETKPFIYEGDISDLIMALEDVDPSDTVLLFGHEPELGDWISYLAEDPGHIRTAGMVRLEINSLANSQATIQWIQQPEKNFPADVAPTLDAATALRLVLDQWVQAQVAFRDFEHAPDLPRTTHRLRVSIRRARALLSFLKPTLHDTTYDDLSAHMRALMQDFALIRELDVLIEQITHVLPQSTELLPYLEDLLAKARASAKQRAASGALQMRLDQVKSDLLVLSFDNAKAIDSDDFKKKLTKRYERWKKQGHKLHQNLDYADYSSIHHLRVLYKKLRYVTEVLEDFDWDVSTEDFAGYQDKLGAICDTYANAIHLTDLTQETKNKLLIDEISSFIEAQMDLRTKLVTELREEGYSQ